MNNIKTIEINHSLSDHELIKLFGLTRNDGIDKLTVDQSAVNYNVVGSYDVVFKYPGADNLTVTLKVVDMPVTSINNEKPDSTGNVELTASDIPDVATKSELALKQDIATLFSDIAGDTSTNTAGQMAILNSTKDGLTFTDVPKVSTETKANIDKEVVKQLGNKLDTKLNLDMGNLDNSGFVQKLDDNKVAYKTDIPTIPHNLRAPFMVEDDEIQLNDPVIIDQNCTMFNLNLQGQEGEDFTYQLPNFVDYPNLEQLRIKLMTSQTGVEGGQRTQYTIRTPHQVFVGGARTLTYDNIELAIIDLFPDREDNKWVADLIYNKEEVENGEVTIEDDFGNSVTNQTIKVGMGLKLESTEGAPIPTDYYEDSPENLQSEMKLVVDQSLFPQRNDSYYATLNYDTLIRGRKDSQQYVDGYLWFDNVIVPEGSFIEVDRDNKAFGIQESDNKDPNVTGGEPVLIAIQLNLNDVTEEDGYVKVELIDKINKRPILNQFGQPIGMTKTFKQGQEFGKLLLADIVKAKGIQEFKVRITHNFKSGLQVADRVHGDSCIMIQYLEKAHQTGEALQQFEIDNDVRLLWDMKYLGLDFYTMKPFLDDDVHVQEIPSGVGDNEFGLTQFYAVNPMRAEIKDKSIHLTDNGSQMAYFNIGHVFNAEDTMLLKDSQVRFVTQIKDPHNAFKMVMVGWTGEADKYTHKIITGITNVTPTVETDWTILQDTQINETPSGASVNKSMTTTIPEEVKNVGYLLIPLEEVSPMDLTIEEFRIDSNVQDSLYFLQAPVDKSTNHLTYSEDHLEMSMKTPKGNAGVRYTINADPTKFPVGTIDKGKAPIINDMVWKDSSYAGEGALKFKSDGEVSKISGTLRLHIGEKATRNQTVKTWFTMGNQPDTPIPGTEMTSMLMYSNKDFVNMSFNTTDPFEVRADDEVWFWVSTNVDDGAYAESSYATPLSNITIEFKEEVNREY